MTVLFPHEAARPWPLRIHTDPEAVPIAWRLVKRGTPVIHVVEGKIRGATVSGPFELAYGDSEQSFPFEDGQQKAEVMCYWHGRKLVTRWMHITIQERLAVDWSHEGQVIIDIGRVEFHSNYCR
jgi:hypothetical protein